MDNLSGLSPEQQALFASIMGNSSQAQAHSPVIPTPDPTPAVAPEPVPAAAAPAGGGGDDGRVLSQAEIDALIASLAN